MLAIPRIPKTWSCKTLKPRQAPFVRSSSRRCLYHSLQPRRLLVNPEFIALLFAYRQVFHAIAVRSIHAGSVPSAVVCWVDVVFAKLAVAVTAICPGGPPSASQSETVHGSMQKQLDCYLLRAATQLPSAPIAWKLRLRILTLECTRHMGRSAHRSVCRLCVACCLPPCPASTLWDVCATASAAGEQVPGNYQVSLLRIQATSCD